MSKSFDELLAGLHHDEAEAVIVTTTTFTIGPNRALILSEGFSNIVAFEGDVNATKITFSIPEKHNGHPLNACQHKELRWKNLTSGAEGVSALKQITADISECYNCCWEIPAEACARAGNIEIAISFYDKEDGQIAFAWNTASYSDLKVEKTMSSVGADIPAIDDVLLIDEETHNILAPNGYNNTICNYGDKGTVDVYFIVNKYLGRNHGLNILSADCNVFVVIVMNEQAGCDNTNITTTPYSYEISGRQNEGMALITWHVPAGVTAGKAGPNTMKIAIGFDDGTHRWVSNAYEKLTVGHSLFEVQGGEPGEEWGLTDDYIQQVIENYFNNGMVVFDPET